MLEGQNSSVEYEKLLQACLLHSNLRTHASIVEGIVVLLLQMFGDEDL